MDKSEAIAAMQDGKKLTHEYFSENKWVTINNNGHYKMEDGATVSEEVFWKDRPGKSFETGWEIFQEKPEGDITGKQEEGNPTCDECGDVLPRTYIIKNGKKLCDNCVSSPAVDDVREGEKDNILIKLINWLRHDEKPFTHLLEYQKKYNQKIISSENILKEFYEQTGYQPSPDSLPTKQGRRFTEEEVKLIWITAREFENNLHFGRIPNPTPNLEEYINSLSK